MNVHDSDLVAATLDGNPAAFGVLATRHRSRTRAVAARVLGDPHEAEDVTQDALLHAYLGLGALRDPGRFGAWLAAIARNLARMRARRREPRPEAAAPDAGEAPSAERVAEGRAAIRLVDEAIRELPPAERDAVLACSVLGSSCEEAAVLLGRSPGAVRVSLHRARTRLRERIGEVAPATVTTREEREMIEVEVSGVLTRVGEDGGSPQDVCVVLLKEKGGERLLPMWIGAPEAGALALQLAGEQMPRPMSADLMVRLVETLGGTVERVVVSSIRESTFFAVVTLAAAGGGGQVDARPSDALNLARRAGAPIYVDEGVLREAAVAAEGLHERLDREEERVAGTPPVGEWLPLTPEHVRARWGVPPSPPPLRVEE